MKQNNRSDFSFLWQWIKNGEAIALPDYPFTLELYTRSTCRHIVSSSDCEVIDDKTLLVKLNFNGNYLPCGKLMAVVKAAIPDATYPDGYMNISDPIDTEVEIWEGRSDDSDAEVTIKVLSTIYKGDPFTYDDFTAEQLASLTAPATEAAKHCNDIAYETEAAELARVAAEQNRVNSENEREADFEAMHNELAGKVDIIAGKGLSTEDFTTALRTKLEELHNYNDATLTAAVEAVQTQLNTLMSGNVSEAIESFNEIEAFLAGITDAQTLAGLMSDLRTEVVGLIPNVPNWAMQPAKPSYTPSEVGAASPADVANEATNRKYAYDILSEVAALSDCSLEQRITTLESLLAAVFSGGVVVPALKVTDLLAQNTDIVRVGVGAPSIIPDRAGQFYINTTAKTLYYSNGNTAISDWNLA